MKTRANYRMVEETDPNFGLWWDAYPRRVAKKEARKAWARIDPSAELVEKMLLALEWQVPAFKWDGESADFAPYPASWLNAERWTDEPPRIAQKADIRGHVPPCQTQADCLAKVFQDARKEKDAR